MSRTKPPATRRAPGLRLVLALSFAPSLAHGAHPLATDDVGTLGSGGLEIEVSGLVGGAPATSGSPDLDVSLVAHAGLTSWLDVGAAALLQASITDGTSSATPLLDVKVRALAPDGGVPGLAVRLDYQPTMRTGDGSWTGHEVGGVLAMTLEAVPVAVHLNVGAYGRGLGTPEETLALVGSATAITAVADGLAVAGEATVEGSPGDALTVSALGALQWEAEPSRVLSAGAGPTWSPDDGPGWVVTLGFTAGFGP